MKNYNRKEINRYGTFYYLNNNLHRIDGPAIEYFNDHKEWWINGKLHRTDGPAIEGKNSDKEWIINGNLHRIDGPAIERSNGIKDWYINGEFIGSSWNGFTEKDFEQYKKLVCLR